MLVLCERALGLQSVAENHNIICAPTAYLALLTAVLKAGVLSAVWSAVCLQRYNCQKLLQLHPV